MVWRGGKGREGKGWGKQRKREREREREKKRGESEHVSVLIEGFESSRHSLLGGGSRTFTEEGEPIKGTLASTKNTPG